MEQYVSKIPSHPKTLIEIPPNVTHLLGPCNGSVNADIFSYLTSFPPGYCFKPTDDVLIKHYLARKIKNESLPPNMFHDVNISDFDPQTLAEDYEPQGEMEWYFFTPRERKYKNGGRPNRAARGGYWKASGPEKKVLDEENRVIGYKTTLVYHKGKPPRGDRTPWVMHEFRLIDSSRPASEGMRLDDWVLCKIYRKVEKKKNNNINSEVQGQPGSGLNPSENEEDLIFQLPTLYECDFNGDLFEED